MQTTEHFGCLLLTSTTIFQEFRYAVTIQTLNMYRINATTIKETIH